MGAGTIPDATFDRIGAVLTRAMEGLTFEQLKRQPAGPESNPIGWLAFPHEGVNKRLGKDEGGAERIKGSINGITGNLDGAASSPRSS